MIVKDFTISDPCIRDMRTIRLSPSLASHAPNVSRIIVSVAEGLPTILIVYGTNRTTVSITPSNDSRDISRCDWCATSDVIARIGAN